MNLNVSEKSALGQRSMPDAAPVVKAISEVLARHAVTLDTQSFPVQVYASSLLYMVYWFHRLKDPKRKRQIRESVQEYLGTGAKSAVIDELLADESLKLRANEHIGNDIMVRKTVDVLIMRERNGSKDFLTLDRTFFPRGIALPGGLISDDDENNDFGIPGNIFAALRVTGEKVLRSYRLSYGIASENDRKYYFVSTESGQSAKIYMDRTVSHSYRDHLKEITFPSDTRHIVDTIGYIVEVTDPENVAGKWLPEAVISAPERQSFAFRHHKQMAASLIAKNFSRHQGVSHHEWIRESIASPVETYDGLRKRFEENGNDPNTSVPELLPVVEHLRNQLSQPAIDQKCRMNASLGFMRDQLVHKFHHVTLQNGTMCPYASTLRIIFEAVGFFDVVCRSDRNLSTHFQKKYWYRYEQLMSRIPEAIVIPTFDNISATDLMKVRGVPMYFVGISTEPVYVDEFWQSPLEFLIHDLNHSWKMLDMDDRFLAKYPNLTRRDLIDWSSSFIREYLPKIAIGKNDSEEGREMKKLKKIILFEVGHEDARPLLPDIIGETLLEAEGYEFPDDVVRYSDDGSQAYLERRTIPGITALSYVRHKLQHGFFDQTDSQNIQIVSPKYRSVEWIVKAAESLLAEFGTKIPEAVAQEGLTAYLTRQACSRWPSILHAPENLDPAVSLHGDGTLSQ